MLQATVLRITDEERNRIRNSYDRSDEEIEKDIDILKEWLKKQPHLPQEDEKRLRAILISNKFSLEKTKKKLDVYYSSKHIVPEYFINREPNNPEISYLMDQIILMPLPFLTPELHRVFYMRIQGDGFNVFTYSKILFGLLDARLTFDEALGDHYIIDSKNIQLQHLVQFTPSVINTIYGLSTKAFSDRIAGVHFVNMPSYASSSFLLFKSILSDKLAKRIHIHKNEKELCRIINPELLPNECGGTAGPMDELYGNWKKFYKSKNDWLKESAEKKSDESKRIGEPLNSDMFGIHGSFRRLAVD